MIGRSCRGGTLQWIRALAGVGALATCAMAQATAYRCDDAGRVTYTNLPCPSGKQTELKDRAAAPTAEDLAAAQRRQRADQAKLDAIGRDRATELKQDQQAAALAARRNVGFGKQADACTKLALKVKRAHEDYDAAGPRDQPARRVRLRRAEDDYAALCRKR